MNKIIGIVMSVAAVVTLSSFIVINNHSQKSSMDDEMNYHTSVKMWCNSENSQTIHISYQTINGGRRYYYTFGDPRDGFGAKSYYPVYRNPLYQSSSCTDFRRKYQYTTKDPDYNYSTGCYFNCNMPYYRE